MTDKAKQLRAKLKSRQMTFKQLAEQAKVNYFTLSKVLSERNAGRFTWKRIQPFLDDEEQQLVVDLYGPVFSQP